MSETEKEIDVKIGDVFYIKIFPVPLDPVEDKWFPIHRQVETDDEQKEIKFNGKVYEFKILRESGVYFYYYVGVTPDGHEWSINESLLHATKEEAHEETRMEHQMAQMFAMKKDGTLADIEGLI